jgi:hypothetical protein
LSIMTHDHQYRHVAIMMHQEDHLTKHHSLVNLSLNFNKNNTRYDAIRYNSIRYDTIRFHTIRYDTIRFHTIRFHTIRYDTIPYDTIRYVTLEMMFKDYMTPYIIYHNTLLLTILKYYRIKFNVALKRPTFGQDPIPQFAQKFHSTTNFLKSVPVRSKNPIWNLGSGSQLRMK